jgi:hypothetical protein
MYLKNYEKRTKIKRMKRFYYIDENAQEQLDLIWLLEYATDNKLNYDECVIALSRLEKYINIKPKK